MTGTAKKYKHKDGDKDTTPNLLIDTFNRILISGPSSSWQRRFPVCPWGGGASIHRQICDSFRRFDRIRIRVCSNVHGLQTGDEHHAVE
jgi:hypothetical protein